MSLQTSAGNGPVCASQTIDGEFQRLMDFIGERDQEQLRQNIIHNLAHLKKTSSNLYHNSVNYFNTYGYWGTYDPENNNFDLAEQRAAALTGHREDYAWLYHRLGDCRSKRIMNNILHYWLMSNPDRIGQLQDKVFDQYFDLDLVACTPEEVLADIGGYIGDTLVSYVKSYGKGCYKKIYSYEILPQNIELIEKNIKLFELENVEVCQKGVGSQNGTMYVSDDGQVSSVRRPSGEGEREVPMVTLDDDIQEKVTYIKMDIEGGEEEALAGCLKTIQLHRPKLALSVYHNYKDLWKLARMIDEANPTYRFYLRYYGAAILPTEYILYAL